LLLKIKYVFYERVKMNNFKILSLIFVMSFHNACAMEAENMLSPNESKLFYDLQGAIMQSHVPSVRNLLDLGADPLKTPGVHDTSSLALAKSVKECKRGSTNAAEIYDLLLFRTTFAVPVSHASSSAAVTPLAIAIPTNSHDLRIPTAHAEFANEHMNARENLRRPLLSDTPSTRGMPVDR
jgi:hypothetical protein